MSKECQTARNVVIIAFVALVTIIIIMDNIL